MKAGVIITNAMAVTVYYEDDPSEIIRPFGKSAWLIDEDKNRRNKLAWLKETAEERFETVTYEAEEARKVRSITDDVLLFPKRTITG